MSSSNATPVRVVVLGASGAVGQECVRALQFMPAPAHLTLLNRRELPELRGDRVDSHVVDVMNASSYAHLLGGHDTAVCTFGVGEPSVMSKDEFVRIDKVAVLDFATACKAAGVQHFQLLNSIGASSASRSFYLRTKGELCDALEAWRFARLSIFQPSMILTPTNRYGLMQGLMLLAWPLLTPLLAGPLMPYRGVPVATLGAAIAANVFTTGRGTERLRWPDFKTLAARLAA